MFPEGSILLLSDNRGQYIPQHFFQEVKPECISKVSEWARETCLAGPETDGYWDAWNDVECNAEVLDHTTGIVYTIYQDGDCWLIPKDAEWNMEDI